MFDSVPNNALLWLINHTEGVYERSFFYNENGAIEWWYLIPLNAIL